MNDHMTPDNEIPAPGPGEETGLGKLMLPRADAEIEAPLSWADIDLGPNPLDLYGPDAFTYHKKCNPFYKDFSNHYWRLIDQDLARETGWIEYTQLSHDSSGYIIFENFYNENGLSNRQDGDWPAKIEYPLPDNLNLSRKRAFLRITYFNDHKKHRDHGPAIIYFRNDYFQNDQALIHYYYQRDLPHRVNGPFRIGYTPEGEALDLTWAWEGVVFSEYENWLRYRSQMIFETLRKNPSQMWEIE